MSTAFVVFLITIATGAFFLAGLIMISRLNPRGSSDESGAPEGDSLNFRCRPRRNPDSY
jgi:hypothetical protein